MSRHAYAENRVERLLARTFTAEALAAAQAVEVREALAAQRLAEVFAAATSDSAEARAARAMLRAEAGTLAVGLVALALRPVEAAPDAQPIPKRKVDRAGRLRRRLPRAHVQRMVARFCESSRVRIFGQREPLTPHQAVERFASVRRVPPGSPDVLTFERFPQVSDNDAGPVLLRGCFDARDGIAREVREAAERLAAACGWTLADACRVLVLDSWPERERERLRARLHTPEVGPGRVVIEAEATASPQEVAGLFERVQRSVLGSKRGQSAERLALFGLFVEGVRAKLGEDVTRRRIREQWNAVAPEGWRFADDAAVSSALQRLGLSVETLRALTPSR